MRRITDNADARTYVESLCDAQAMDRLAILEAELAEENEKQNLVARNTLQQTWLRHIADSAQLLAWADSRSGRWLDLGSGAGFPGLVIAAMRPETVVVMVESRRKRVVWLERMIDVLGLGHLSVQGCRLEQVETFPAAVISARAFAPLPRLLALSARFSTSDTEWVLPKGRSAEQELRELGADASKMFHVEHSLTNPEAGIVVGMGQWRQR